MNSRIELSAVERLVLVNQYRLLSKLFPGDADEYERKVDILENGYVLEYRELFYSIAEEVGFDICKEVLDILDMHRALRQAVDSSDVENDVEVDDVRFRGFDGNLEHEQLSFARYFMARKDRYDELYDTDDMNSHYPMLPQYRAMMREWKKLPEDRRFELALEDVLRIMGSA